MNDTALNALASFEQECADTVQIAIRLRQFLNHPVTRIATYVRAAMHMYIPAYIHISTYMYAHRHDGGRRGDFGACSNLPRICTVAKTDRRQLGSRPSWKSVGLRKPPVLLDARQILEPHKTTINTRISRSGSRANTRGIAEIMFRRGLMFTWSVGVLNRTILFLGVAAPKCDCTCWKIARLLKVSDVFGVLKEGAAATFELRVVMVIPGGPACHDQIMNLPS